MTRPEADTKKFVIWHALEALELRIFVVGFIVLLVLLMIVYQIGTEHQANAFDFDCFAFACLAGVIAGAGFAYGSDATPPSNKVHAGKEKAFYTASLAALFLALINYDLSHATCQRFAFRLEAAAFITAVTMVLAPRLIPKRATGIVFYMEVVILMIVAIAVLVGRFGLVYGFSSMFDVHVFKYTDQAP
jgi:hypothetical protein